MSEKIVASEKTLAEQKDDLSSTAGAGEETLKLSAEKEKCELRKKDLLKLKTEFSSLEKYAENLKNAQEEYRCAKNKSDESANIFYINNTAYLDEQAGILAEKLAPNTPCPVCGSLTHPLPAKKSANAPTEEKLKLLKTAADNDALFATKKSEDAANAKGIFDTAEKSVASLIAEIFGATEKNNGAIQEEASAEIAKIDSEIFELSAKISIAEKNKIRFEELSKKIPELESVIENLKTKLSVAEKEKIALEANIAHEQEQAKSIREKLKYESKGAAQNAIAKFKNTLAEIDAKISAAETAHKECDAKVSVLTGKISQLEEELKDAPQTDIEEEKQKQSLLTKEKSSLESIEKITFNRIETNSKAIKNIQHGKSNLETAEQNFLWIDELYKTAAGLNTGNKLSLENYVQGVFFDKIIRRANLRLRDMTNSHYELKRRLEASSANSKFGLELNLVDHEKGGEREVSTLSGGESFLASLCLALGLSEEIQASAGGIKLDSMFIDEGFGSLDKETLGIVMKTLATLSEGEQLVGIISHVDELISKIDKKILVTKEPSGTSTVKLVL